MTSLISKYKTILGFEIVINAAIEVFEEEGWDTENLIKVKSDINKQVHVLLKRIDDTSDTVIPNLI